MLSVFAYANGSVPVSGTTDALVYFYRAVDWLGIRIFQHPQINLNYIARFILLILFTYILGPLTFNVIYFIENNNMSTSTFLTSLSGNFNVWGIPLKLIVVFFFLKQLIESEKYMKQLDSRIQTDVERDILRELAQSANRTVLQFCLVYGVYLHATIGIATFLLNRPGYGLYFHFIEPSRSSRELYLQALLEFIVVGVLLAAQVVNDSYPSVYIQIVRAHLKILSKRVERIGHDTVHSCEENYNALKLCVLDHHCILQLMDHITPAISLTLFFQFLLTTLLMGTTLVNLVLFADNTARVSCITYIAAILAQISPACYQASLLQTDCELLPSALFNCNWIHQDQRFRKILVYFIQQAQVPMEITALKMFTINLGTEISILKFSFSLYTLLSNMDFGSKK